MSTIKICSFCSKPAYPGKGLTFIRNDGTVFRFCTSKCNKSFKMKRSPRRVKWTQAYRAVHGKVLTNDVAFQIEKKRMRAVKYDRDLWNTTIDAMDRLDKVKLARLQRHKVAAKRAEAIKLLSCKRAVELGLNADTTVKIPNLDKMRKRREGIKAQRVRASIVAKYKLRRVAEKIPEVE
ncbi:Ribosomal protein L24 [Spironucleus salmonicida]|uniref:Ribosomal protein L24 n=1 Tax=Spironucleus salmonicida TaxID=348837 RepID=V6LKZ4_9EUKA|nr:Ribosomal protein L24 [Spironucleus salmonicida]|eukprot:EST45222.1 Ribosomal protein L24 [Spironucleus salmonicida]